MKHIQILMLSFAIILLTNCNKDDDYDDYDDRDDYELRFGETQKGFLIDSVYQTETNGILYVQFEANSTGAFLQILADSINTPVTEISKISAWGSATIPLQKNTYWKVEKHPNYMPANLPIIDTLITWTPIF